MHSYMVDNLSVAFHVLPLSMLISLAIDEILLPRYVNWSTNFKSLSLEQGMVPFFSKHMNSVLSEFTLRPKPLAACSLA